MSALHRSFRIFLLSFKIVHLTIVLLVLPLLHTMSYWALAFYYPSAGSQSTPAIRFKPAWRCSAKFTMPVSGTCDVNCARRRVSHRIMYLGATGDWLIDWLGDNCVRIGYITVFGLRLIHRQPKFKEDGYVPNSVGRKRGFYWSLLGFVSRKDTIGYDEMCSWKILSGS